MRKQQDVAADLAAEERKMRLLTDNELYLVSLFLTDEAKRQNLTHVDLAIASGLAQSTVFRVLQGDNVKVATLVRMAYALGFRLSICFEEK